MFSYHSVRTLYWNEIILSLEDKTFSLGVLNWTLTQDVLASLKRLNVFFPGNKEVHCLAEAECVIIIDHATNMGFEFIPNLNRIKFYPKPLQYPFPFDWLRVPAACIKPMTSQI